jgi:hypothetical protein
MGFQRRARRLVTLLPQVAAALAAGAAVAVLERRVRGRGSNNSGSYNGGGARRGPESLPADCCCEVRDGASDAGSCGPKGQEASAAATTQTWVGYAAAVLQQLGLPAPPAGLSAASVIERLRGAFMLAVSGARLKRVQGGHAVGRFGAVQRSASFVCRADHSTALSAVAFGLPHQ